MAAITGLSYSDILTISNTLSTNSKSMQTLLGEIKTLFNKVGSDDTWSGTAASETKQTFDTLSKKFPEFYEAVDEASKYLKQVVANYQAADKAVTSKK